MYRSQVTPVLTTLLLWLSLPCHCQYDDPYGGPPYYGEPQPYGPYTSPEGPPPQNQPPQQYYPPNNYYNNNANVFNPFLPTGQGQNQNQQLTPQQQQLLQQLQKVQGSYPNLPSVPFQTVSPNNPVQRVDKYPFQSQLPGGNDGSANSNNLNSLGNLHQQQQQQTFGSALLNQHYPKFPEFPFQTIQPGQTQQGSGSPLINNNPYPYKPKIELPRIRVIEFPASEYFEYGGGKLVQPKRANADLYVGGSGGDVPITSKVFIECTGPNQVEWMFNGTSQQQNDLSVTTKNFQITIPEERSPIPGSREYTYLRLGLEKQISDKDTGMYICRDRILPQNYISIRVLVAKPTTGRPNYPFVRPKDPNTIYYSRRDPSVVLPCKIENEDVTITLHKHEGGKLSCPYSLDGRVSYDRFKGFIMQTQAFRDLEGRYVCVGDFNGSLRLMKYKLVNSEDFTTRYSEGEVQNIIALDGDQKSSGEFTAASTTLAQINKVPDSRLSELAKSGNLTAAGLVDPRSEFDIVEADTLPFPVPKETKTGEKIDSDLKS